MPDDERTDGEPDEVATDVGAALIIDVLFQLGIEDPFALSPSRQKQLIAEAVAAGRIDEERVSLLRDLGVLDDAG